MNQISPLACVSPDAVLGNGLRIGPFAIIEPGVVLGDGCRIEGGATIKTGTVLGDRVWVHHGAVIGGLPQDYSFDATRRTGVKVGDGTILREGVTINRATKPDTSTTVGRDCMLMANSHVAHDGAVGDRVTLANGALLAGHVVVGDHAFISGNCAIHQHCIVGESVMCSGLAAITGNIPPFCIAVERNGVAGLNLVGMRRRGLARESIAEIRAAYRAVYLAPGMNLQDNARAALDSGDFKTAEARRFFEFFVSCRRPTFVRPRHAKVSADE